MTFPAWNWGQSGERLLSLAIAYILALPIGWNWEKIRHNSGLRTFPLVAVASCSYVLVAKHVLGPGNQNLDRVIQGLMTGIGFIGGGAIFRQGVNVRGTATAASIWCVGALGAAVACGAWDIAVMLGVVNLATLRLLRPVKEMLDTERRDPRG
ncbi:MAG TPA: MgtC/SapB family protein [Bryobacteraceae bacterium]|nr:MgtC/SapB family protein [Bryobacteraceae bacterium]